MSGVERRPLTRLGGRRVKGRRHTAPSACCRGMHFAAAREPPLITRLLQPFDKDDARKPGWLRRELSAGHYYVPARHMCLETLTSRSSWERHTRFTRLTRRAEVEGVWRADRSTRGSLPDRA